MIKIKIPATISLAKRAGKISGGEEAVKESIRNGSAALVIMAEDLGSSTKKSLTNSCSYYNVKYIFLGTKEELGRAIGKGFAAAIAICDKGFAESIEKNVEKTTQQLANINGGEVL